MPNSKPAYRLATATGALAKLLGPSEVEVNGVELDPIGELTDHQTRGGADNTGAHQSQPDPIGSDRSPGLRRNKSSARSRPLVSPSTTSPAIAMKA